MIDFKVLDQDSMHNMLVGRPWLRAFRVITSIHHLMIKFPTPNEVGSLRGPQYESCDCYHKTVKEFRMRRYEGKSLPFEGAEDIHTKPSGEVHAHYFVEGPEEEETYVTGNSVLTLGNISRIRSVEEVVVNHAEEIMQKEVNGEKLEGRSEILQGLGNNFKVDAPQKEDVPLKSKNGIEVDAPPNEDAPSSPALHKPCLVLRHGGNRPRSNMSPVEYLPEFYGHTSKSRLVSGERAIALKEEVDQLLKVGLIKESFYPEWLANPVLVKKPNGKWRTVSEYSISAVLVREEDGQQSPVYYMSKRLHDAETRYTSMEKLVYALVLASRKLRPYFQAHRVEVRTTYPLRQVLHKPESSGRMLKWAIELGQFDLEYMPRTVIKGQALADFLLEFDSAVDDKALIMLHPPHVKESLEEFPHPWWILHVDVAVNNGGADRFGNGSDSELVVNQVNGGFQERGPRTELYLRCTQRLIGMFKEVRLECVPREKNSNADALAKMGSQQEAVLLGSIPLKIQEIPSIPEIEIMQVDEAPKKTWMAPILAYIHKGTLPEDKFKARRLRYQAARYVMYDEVLYKRRFNQPLLRCVDKEEGNYILREVHEGIYGNHSGGSSLAMKVLRQGYYWPTMKEDATNFIRACDRCQRFANYSSMPSTLLTPMVSPWPFAMWGIDLIGELPKAKWDVKYAVVATEAVNKIIKHTLKAKLEERKVNWPEELSKVMWSYNTTPRSTTGETPFMLTYDYEVMVPVEVGSGSFHRDRYTEEDAEVSQRLYLDLLEETRENSQLRLAAYQKRATGYYNKKVKGQLLKVGDLVLRKVMPNTKNPQHGEVES
ncbi:uncharacterized protein LOC141679939 [Apium graveolens]|uniref:uncharacterized protein LOC141679939 n=1 Tax=Apium graveolens TaxID=4045 RepID=UPI003D7A68F2